MKNEDYTDKRKKNNEAVKKSRQKSRSEAQKNEERLKQLKDENEEYRSKIEGSTRELEQLKSLFLAQTSNPNALKLTEEQIKFLKEENVAVKMYNN